jgi:ABC-type transporter Mla maintaining outer membrane lipid asymmetry ATPase subunit MlaF
MTRPCSEANVETSKPIQNSHEVPNLLVPGLTRWRPEDGTIIRMSKVSKRFGDLVVLDELDLDIQPAMVTCILGESGSGKTVLIKHLNGLLVPQSGNIELFGNDLTALGPVELDATRKRIGTLFQNYALFDSMTVVENVAFPLVQNKAMSIAEAEELAAHGLAELGLESVLKEFPSALSGGMKKRVAVARSIIWNPEMLLLDDPTTGLDPIMTQYVDELLTRISKERKLTTVMVSHNLASIFRMADMVAVLHRGKIVEYGTPDEIKHSNEPSVKALVGKAARAKIEVSERDIEEEGAIVVKMVDVKKGFGDRQILKGVNFTARKGEITVIIGGSGAGKSVMMKHILGLLRADEGQVELFGRDVGGMDEKELRNARQGIGMLFQHSALLDSMSVIENVAFPLYERREASKAEALERAMALLNTLRLSEIAERFPSEISNGQQKRVSLARALISKPGLMVYDEPTTGQDPILSDYVENMILEAQDKFDLTSIIISHDMASTMRIADKVAMIYEGQIILEAPPNEFVNTEDPRVKEFVFASAL